METKKHHIVMLPYPSQGHINPLMQLAKQLAMLGATITFVNTTHNHQRILASRYADQGTAEEGKKDLYGGRIKFAHIPDGLPDDRIFDLATLSEAIDAHMPAPFHDLVAALMASAHPPCSIFSDLFLPFTQDVANAFHLPRIAIWLQSASSFSIHLHLPQVISDGFLPIKPGDSNHLITSIPGHPPLSLQDLPSFFQEDISSYMSQFKLRPYRRLSEAKAILINTFYELESELLDVLSVQHGVSPAGPLLPPALLNEHCASGDTRTGTELWPEDSSCLSWLDAQEECSVLYIAFGSIAMLSSEQFKELVLGLAASEKPILWAIRPDLMDRLAPPFPPYFHEGQHVHLTSWAPQALVLSHPSINTFLTHCGWNSTIESMCMGVPTLCWPCLADQRLNAKWMVDEWRVGKRFEPSSSGLITREEVERLVRLLMDSTEGHELRESARAISTAWRKNVVKTSSYWGQLLQTLHDF